MVTKSDLHPHRLLDLAIRCIVTLLIVSCGTPPATEPSATPTSGPTALPTTIPSPKPLPNVKISVAQGSGDVANVIEGDEVAIFVEVVPYESLNWTWEVSGTSGGTLNVTEGENVVYKSGKAGVDIVVAQATTTDGQLIIQRVTVNVAAAAADLIPNSGPALTPLEGVFPTLSGGVEFLFPEDQPDSIKRQYIEEGECLYSGPTSMQITYNFPQDTGGGWGIHWANLPGKSYNLEEQGFTTITFWVRGKSGNEKFQVGLKDKDRKEIMVQSERYILVNSDEWRLVTIPLRDFFDDRGHIDLTAIENMSIGFSSAHGSGSICIDELAFQ